MRCRPAEHLGDGSFHVDPHRDPTLDRDLVVEHRGGDRHLLVARVVVGPHEQRPLTVGHRSSVVSSPDEERRLTRASPTVPCADSRLRPPAGRRDEPPMGVRIGLERDDRRRSPTRPHGPTPRLPSPPPRRTRPRRWPSRARRTARRAPRSTRCAPFSDDGVDAISTRSMARPESAADSEARASRRQRRVPRGRVAGREARRANDEPSARSTTRRTPALIESEPSRWDGHHRSITVDASTASIASRNVASSIAHVFEPVRICRKLNRSAETSRSRAGGIARGRPGPRRARCRRSR